MIYRTDKNGVFLNSAYYNYSHNDYSDLWDLTFGQIYKYVDLNTVPIVFLCK